MEISCRNVIDKCVTEYLHHPSKSLLNDLLQLTEPLVFHFASCLSGGRYDQDLIQTGFEGVLKALKHFVPTREVSFVTFAGHYIMGEIRHYLRKESRYYRPRFIEGLQEKARDIMEDYFKKHGEIPANGYLAQTLNIQENGVGELLKSGLVSLDELDLEKINCLHYESFKLPIEDRILLYESIRKLSNIKQRVIYYLFFKDYTQQQAAEHLGINQRKVSRLLKSCIDDLKTYMAS